MRGKEGQGRERKEKRGAKRKLEWDVRKEDEGWRKGKGVKVTRGGAIKEKRARAQEKRK